MNTESHVDRLRRQIMETREWMKHNEFGAKDVAELEAKVRELKRLTGDDA